MSFKFDKYYLQNLFSFEIKNKKMLTYIKFIY